jgi:hypothetical protein
MLRKSQNSDGIIYYFTGRDIAEAVSHRIFPQRPEFNPRAVYVGFVVQKSGTRAHFSPRSLDFPGNHHFTDNS